MKLSKLAVAGALGLAALGGQAEASVVIDIAQDGHNVVAVGSGTIDLTGLTYYVTAGLDMAGHVWPATAAANFGALNDPIDVYTGASGPASFGTGGATIQSSGSGGAFGVTALTGVEILVPGSYVSGKALSGSSTFDGQTLASLGLTPGTYVYSWNSSPVLPAADDSLTVKIGGTIPEPATWVMMMLGFAGLGFAGYRGRRTLAQSL